jgi:hypothetical protein
MLSHPFPTLRRRFLDRGPAPPGCLAASAGCLAAAAGCLAAAAGRGAVR